jgi:hypothetical protein
MTTTEIISIIISIFSLLGTIAIAAATGIYTHYSKRTINELKKQNIYLKEINEEDYKLKRKSISKKLCYEITANEQYLNYLFIFFNSKPDSFDKMWDYFKERKYKNLFNDDIYKEFIRSDIEFKDDKIFENLFYLDLSYKKIQGNMNLLMLKNPVLKPQTLDLFLSDTTVPIKKSLEKIEELYGIFNEETGYNHKRSNFYKETKGFIEFLEIQNF